MESQLPSGQPDAQWGRIREILNRALELSPPQRPAYLDEACGGDVSLRAEVESLLAASEGSAWIDRPALASLTGTLTSKPPSPGDAPIQPGQTIGHYTVVEKIGAGGMGTVYKAVDKRLNRPVALKVISHLGGGWEEKRRFFQEAKAASALNNPNIVTIYEYSSDGGMDFIAMEYIQGNSLHNLLSKRDPSTRQIALETLLEYARQAAGAIAKAHSAGIVHRDLKPGNIMVTGEGVVKVLDFGVAKQNSAAGADPDSTRTEALTKAGTSLGTPSYMSPEQAKGEVVDHRSDIFSFGIILYEIACGRRPFRGDSPTILYEIAHVDPPSADTVLPAMPKQLAALIERCLKKEKDERPQSMSEVASELATLLQPGTAAKRAHKISRRGLVAALVFIAAVAAGIWFLNRAKPVTTPAPERTIEYSIEAQKMRGGQSVGEPYAASARDTFEAGWKFRLRVHSPQPGFLYLINEGPGRTGSDRLWILYPPPTSVGIAALPAGETRSTGWYVFDRNPGTERLWIVWAGAPVDLLQESLRASAGGEVQDPAPAGRIRSFLAGLGWPSKTAVTESASGVQLRAAGGVLGGLIELRHQ